VCGICGTIDWDGRGEAPAREADVSAMLERLAHRGPDGWGVASRGRATFGAVRLAIRGLGDGQQPIVDDANGIIVVCNGEIDNHRELKRWLASRGRPVAAETDVAVLPGLFLELGSEFVERLSGAFSIGLWSARDQLLLLARDRAGERPLHFHASEEAWFASEISALAAVGHLRGGVNTQAVRGYLAAGFFPAPSSPFEGIRKVGPGEIIEIRGQSVSTRRYWRWTSVPAPAKAAANLGEFDAVFREAVRSQSDVDVPYGVYMSGGVDSSLVAAVLRKLRPDYTLHSYTLRFFEPSYDESGYAEFAARLLGLELHRVDVNPEVVPATLTELIASSGEPLADPAWVPTALLSRRAAQDVKIALVGEGADELFGGYPTYLGAGLADRYARLPAFIRSLVRRGVERWPATDKKVTVSFLLKRFVRGDGLAAVPRHLLWTSVISPELLGRLGVATTESWRLDPVQPGGLPPGDMLSDLQRVDLENSLAEGLLTKADRASMEFAIELRAPYLDVSVMEFAARLAVRDRIRGFTTKAFLKQYALKYLPSSIVNRRKRGLSVPLARWLREPLHDWARSRLSSALLGEAGVRNEAAVEMLEEHRLRKADHSRALWALIVLSEWLQWAAQRNVVLSASKAAPTAARMAS
jgi:asparagine synthase (glutamine-hydrolysing)